MDSNLLKKANGLGIKFEPYNYYFAEDGRIYQSPKSLQELQAEYQKLMSNKLEIVYKLHPEMKMYEKSEIFNSFFEVL